MGFPFSLFSFAAILPWTLFSEGLTLSTTSMVSNAGIMSDDIVIRVRNPEKKYIIADRRTNTSHSGFYKKSFLVKTPFHRASSLKCS